MSDLKQIAETLFATLAGELEHEGDTAGYSFLPEDTAIPAIESALRDAQREALESAAEEWCRRTELQAEHVYGWLRARAVALPVENTPAQGSTMSDLKQIAERLAGGHEVGGADCDALVMLHGECNCRLAERETEILAVLQSISTLPEQEIRERLGTDIQADGSLDRMTDGYVRWEPGWANATLDGNFSADELEAIAQWMRGDPK